MKYTAKDICKIYNINRETLRYYEKMDLIHPEIDEANRYRYYDDWDINFIGECRKYRSMGFSIKEIEEVLKRDSLHDFITKLEKKQEEIQQQLLFYEQWNKRNAEYVESLKSIKERMGRFELIEAEARYCMPYRQQYEQIMTEETLSVMSSLMENHTFVDSMLYVPKKDYISETNNFYWGFSIKEKWLDFLKLPTDNMIYFPKRKYICTTIDAGERWGFHYQLFDHIKEFMDKEGYVLDGDITGVLLTRVHEEEKYCRYLEMYFPIKE